jgi:threonine/homoserine/homoserine lactone efflux protein
MATALEFLVTGLLLGLAQGLSPGPLITLIFSETLKYGKKEGIKIAVSPLITDSLIILLVLLVLSSFAQYNLVLGVISLLGAGYLIYLGIENLRAKMERFEVDVAEKGAFKRGIIANLLSPHPYLFWLSIGGPKILEGLSIQVSASALFIIGLYASLVGSKIAVALLVDKSRTFVNSKYYAYIIQALGIVLIIFALLFVIDGMKLMELL